MTSLFLEFGLVIFGAIIIDLIFGDPRNRYHPTAWAGNIMSRIIAYFANRTIRVEKIGGIVAVVIVIIVAICALVLLSHLFHHIIIAESHGTIISIIIPMLIGCILLKCTIAIRGMQRHANAVIESLQNNEIANARANLSTIVKRNTGKLDSTHIISGVLESIAENTVDGATGSLFYYGLFGLPGAFVHRIVNTADSIAGYQNNTFRHLGWFAAHADTVLNYLPARLTAFTMIGAAFLLKYDWKKSYHITMQDSNTTASCNSGYPMAALAGALNVKLEKDGHYTLCADGAAPAVLDVHRAILLMKISILLFVLSVVLPIGFLSSVVYENII